MKKEREVKEAKKLYENKAFEKAAISFEKLLVNYPRNIEFLQGLAKSFSKLSRYDEALEKARQALDLDRYVIDARLVVSNCLKAKKRFDEAKQIISEGIDLKKNEPRFYLQLAALNYLEGDLVSAKEQSLKAIGFDSKLQEARKIYANSSLSLRQADEAIKNYKLLTDKGLPERLNLLQAYLLKYSRFIYSALFILALMSFFAPIIIRLLIVLPILIFFLGSIVFRLLTNK